jgi:hypothetical protein
MAAYQKGRRCGQVGRANWCGLTNVFLFLTVSHYLDGSAANGFAETGITTSVSTANIARPSLAAYSVPEKLAQTLGGCLLGIRR